MYPGCSDAHIMSDRTKEVFESKSIKLLSVSIKWMTKHPQTKDGQTDARAWD